MELAKISTGQHVARYLTVNGRRVRIDANIYDLIDGLLRLGIRTFSSCGADCGGWCRRKHRLVKVTREWDTWQGKRKRVNVHHYARPKLCKESVWLVFETTQDATRFLNVVYSESDPGHVRSGMEGVGAEQYRWIWGVHASDVNDPRYMDHRGYWVGKRTGKPRFDFIAGVVFPHVHLDLVTQRVRARCTKSGV